MRRRYSCVFLLALVCLQVFSGFSREAFHWFPALATEQKDEWKVTLRGLITEEQSRPVVSWVAQKLLGFSEEELGAEERQLFRERTRRFLADDEGGKRIAVEIDGKRVDAGHTARDGQFTLTVSLPRTALAGKSVIQRLRTVVVIDQQRLTNDVFAYVVRSPGISVVSDIDDTIKISQVRNRDELVRNTFLRPFKAVEGMDSVYQNWSEISGATFHYVSGSPWQLFPVLQDFVRTEHFPAGSWHLRTARLTGLSAKELLKAPDSHKRGVITQLLAHTGTRKFVLVGDSGEHDPEIYGELARRYPHRIVAVFIRDVTNESASDARYTKVFRNVPAEKWRLFRSANELPMMLPRE